MHDQLAALGAAVVKTMVTSIARETDGGFTVTAGETRWRARFLLFATGVEDVLPEIAGGGGAGARGCFALLPDL